MAPVTTRTGPAETVETLDLAALFDIDIEEVTTVGSALAALLWALEQRSPRDPDAHALFAALQRLQAVSAPFASHPAGALLRGFQTLGALAEPGTKARKLGLLAQLLSDRVQAEASVEEVLALWATVAFVAQHQADTVQGPEQRHWGATARVWKEGLRQLEIAGWRPGCGTAPA